MRCNKRCVCVFVSYVCVKVCRNVRGIWVYHRKVAASGSGICHEVGRRQEKSSRIVSGGMCHRNLKISVELSGSYSIQCVSGDYIPFPLLQTPVPMGICVQTGVAFGWRRLSTVNRLMVFRGQNGSAILTKGSFVGNII